MVCIIEKTQIYEELKMIEKSLYNPFPYRDIYKMQKDFNNQFSEEDCIIADLNTYWMNIAGSLSYVLKGESKCIPQDQIDLLNFTFFEAFYQYLFLREKITKYPTFYKEYMNNEKTRKLLLDFIS